MKHTAHASILGHQPDSAVYATMGTLTDEPEQLWIGQLAQSLAAQCEQLQTFARLMQANEWPLDVGRLFMDSRYAYERFALAHTSTHEPLRQLALVLFEGYQRLESRRKNLCKGLPVLH